MREIQNVVCLIAFQVCLLPSSQPTAVIEAVRKGVAKGEVSVLSSCQSIAVPFSEARPQSMVWQEGQPNNEAVCRGDGVRIKKPS